MRGRCEPTRTDCFICRQKLEAVARFISLTGFPRDAYPFDGRRPEEI
jgi:hypothetical protein